MVLRTRPELVATLVHDSRYQAEGAFCLQRLRHVRQDGPNLTVELADEWLELQRIGRKQLLLASPQVSDWRSLIAFGIHDEAIAAPRLGTNAVGGRPGLSDELRFGPWRDAMKTDE